LQASGLNNPEV